LGRLGGIGLGEIDEIGAMGKCMFCRRIVVVLATADKEIFRLRAYRWIIPLSLRFEKECEGVGSDLNSIRDSILNSYDMT
jgi:hypothetical protein